MILCDECRYSQSKYAGQCLCNNNLSDFYCEIMDKGEGCNLGKRKKEKPITKEKPKKIKNNTIATNGEGSIGLYIVFCNNTIFSQNGKAKVFTNGKKARNWVNKLNQMGVGNYEIRKVNV